MSQPAAENNRLFLIAKFFGRRVTFLILLGVVFGAAFSLLELAFAAGLQTFLGALGFQSQHGLGSNPFGVSTIEGAAVAFVIVAAVRGLIQYLQYITQTAVGAIFAEQQRKALFFQALRRPVVSISEVINNFSDRISNLQSTVAESHGLFYYATCVLVLLSALFYLYPEATLLALGCMVVVGPIIRFTTKRANHLGQALIKQWDGSSSSMVRALRNLLLIRIYNLQEEEAKKGQESLTAWLYMSVRIFHFQAISMILPSVFGICVLAILGIYLKTHESMSVESIVAFMYVFMRLLQNLSGMLFCFSKISATSPNLWALVSWWQDSHRLAALDSQLERDGSQERPRQVGWRVQDLDFTYPGRGPLLKIREFQIPAGKAVVVVGPSGSGKTTLVNLLLGQLKAPPGSVQVEFDGKLCDIAEGAPRLAALVGYVGPESFVADGSVRAVLTYGAGREVTDQECMEALRTAGCDFLNVESPLDVIISDQGTGFSAGQKQRLALARALLRNPLVMVLDEPTSNLDLDTEERIVEVLARLKGRMTLIIITHREALLRLADSTLRLGDGG